MSLYYKKRILVTGGAGFIGSTFLNLMVPKYPEYHFTNLDALTSVADIHNVLVSTASNYTFVHADIRDKNTLHTLFEEAHFTDIVHFAAETHVDVSIKKPDIFIETNVLGTSNLLALAYTYQIQHFLHISTDEVYGALCITDPAFTESTPLAPNSPYSASKASSDMLVRAYNKTYGLPTLITRCSNNYGPRQDTTKFIPRAITALLQGESIPVYGKGKQIRDWLYVDDHIHALDIVLHSGIAGEIYNVGGGTEMPNIEIAEMLCTLAKKPGAITFVPDRKGHDFRYAIDDSKIRALGYTPTTSLNQGLEKTFKWYTQNQ